MKFILYTFLLINTIYGCGLKYTPPEYINTSSSQNITRKTKVEQYIWESYKKTDLQYHPIVFAPSTVIKPLAYQQLDSLYELKYFNEQLGRYSPKLEQQISAKKAEIEATKQQIIYIEHHIYAIQNKEKMELYYSDIHFDTHANLIEFTITENYEIDSILLPIFKSYVTHESILHPNYQPSVEEEEFYTFFETELNYRTTFEKNSFLNHILNIFSVARTIQSIETKKIIEHLISDKFDKIFTKFDPKMITKIESVWEEEQLIYYRATVTENEQSTQLFFSPFLEIEQSFSK